MATSNALNATAPLDAAAAAKAAFATVENQPFPAGIFTAPQLRWAIIGCGVIANQMAQSFALAGRHLAGIYNRTQSKAEAFAKTYSVNEVFATAEDLYASPNIDAIYITTPHNTHIAFLREALAAGKHVLCEKAITLNSEELAEAMDIANEHNVVLMDATTVLHMPLYVELRRRMASGEFGRLRLAQINFGSWHSYDDIASRFWNRNLAGGAMLDIGVYALSAARLFMESQPHEVVSLANCFKTGVDEESGFVTRNEQGQLGIFSLSMHAKQPKRADLCFDNCYIEIMSYPRADRAVITWIEDGHREEVCAGVEAYALCYEAADLEAAVAGDESKRELITYAADVMETMTELRRSWGVVYPEEE